jgi:nicotinate phosphoribosyltransferase
MIKFWRRSHCRRNKKGGKIHAINGQHVKIIVSSGFDVKKIAWFEAEKTPVDIYGVGEAITKERINFTGDIVLIDGKPQAKIGRKNIESGRLNDII